MSDRFRGIQSREKVFSDIKLPSAFFKDVPKPWFCSLFTRKWSNRFRWIFFSLLYRREGLYQYKTASRLSISLKRPEIYMKYFKKLKRIYLFNLRMFFLWIYWRKCSRANGVVKFACNVAQSASSAEEPRSGKQYYIQNTWYLNKTRGKERNRFKVYHVKSRQRSQI